MGYDLMPDRIPLLRGGGLSLRELCEEDLAPWFSRLSDTEAAMLAGDPVASSIQAAVDGLAYHRDAFRKKEGIRWAIVPEAIGTSVGSIGLGHFNQSERSAEIGAAIDRAHWNQGIATVAGKLVVEYAFRSLRLRRIEAVVLTRNVRVMRVLDKLGFVREGDVPPELEIGGPGNPSVLYSLCQG